MPDTSVSRRRIHSYFKSKGISLISAATYSNIPRQDLADYLDGRNRSRRAYETPLAIINFHKIK